MRRIILVLAAAALMVVLMVTTVSPAFADPGYGWGSKDPKTGKSWCDTNPYGSPGCGYKLGQQ